MLAAEPARSLAVVTCMDCRIDPMPLFGLELGDAHVIRNAGGLVTDDVLRSLALSQALLGTREVIVVQHTGCGLLGDEHELRARVSEAAGAEPPRPLGAFSDLDASVRRQLERLRSAPELVHGGAARGYVYELETGELRQVR
ncbi:MAG TPA: carbonic anhydrase [Thermoleophilaceae bacterium]|nr:carbonic anhydrase [Thermoleophilaceae bacterium]